MRSLFPAQADQVDLDEAYALPSPAGTHVRANFVTSVDGAAEIAGASTALSSKPDRAVFLLLRGLCEVVLVGAETVRREGYGPVRLAQARRDRRAKEGMQPVPPIAVVTGALDLDLTSAFFSEAEARPILLTTQRAPARALESARQVARVVVAGEEHVELGQALHELAALGLRQVLLEGGPTLLGQALEGGHLDELCLTISAVLAGAGHRRIVDGPPGRPHRLRLAHVLNDEDTLFLKYTVTRS